VIYDPHAGYDRIELLQRIADLELRLRRAQGRCARQKARAELWRHRARILQKAVGW